MFAIHSTSREFTIQFTWYNIPGGKALEDVRHMKGTVRFTRLQK